MLNRLVDTGSSVAVQDTSFLLTSLAAVRAALGPK
jgi:hypothetical protein